MGGRNGFDGHGQEVDVLYERANERFAKTVAFVGSYLIWAVLAVLVAGVVVLGS